MERTALIGRVIGGVVGTGFAALALWPGTGPSVTAPPPEPTVASPVASTDGAPQHDLDALSQRRSSQDALPTEERPQPRPIERRAAQEISPLLQPTDADFDRLAHRPLFDEPAAHESSQSHAELLAQVRGDAEDFEAQMKALAETAPEPVAREAMERAAVVYDRVAMELPAQPPTDIAEEDIGSWVQALDRQRAELHERARALRESR
ncbi:MAG: hypothetical protein AB8H79_24245 [Myxococcota bacterium]